MPYPVIVNKGTDILQVDVKSVFVIGSRRQAMVALEFGDNQDTKSKGVKGSMQGLSNAGPAMLACSASTSCLTRWSGE